MINVVLSEEDRVFRESKEEEEKEFSFEEGEMTAFGARAVYRGWLRKRGFPLLFSFSFSFLFSSSLF